MSFYLIVLGIPDIFMYSYKDDIYLSWILEIISTSWTTCRLSFYSWHLWRCTQLADFSVAIYCTWQSIWRLVVLVVYNYQLYLRKDKTVYILEMYVLYSLYTGNWTFQWFYPRGHTVRFYLYMQYSGFIYAGPTIHK